MPTSWAAVLKTAQLYEIIRLYDISRLDSIVLDNDIKGHDLS